MEQEGVMYFRDYDIRVWSGGFVYISSYEYLGYATSRDGGMGIHCNCDSDNPLYRQLRECCMDVANAMRALDDTIAAIEEGRCESTHSTNAR